MRHIAKNVRAISGGERAVHMTAKAPPGLIRLDSGSPSFTTPAHICDAVKQAIDGGHTGYILEKGVSVLLEAICDLIAQDTGAAYAPSQVLITNGSSSGIYAVMTCLVDADEVGRRLRDRGVALAIRGATTFRAVTHLDVTREDVDRAASALREAVA